MRTIALAIAGGLVLYTVLTLSYRKSGRPHEPYAESRQRSAQDRLLAAGWNTFDAVFERATDFPAPRGNLRTAPARSPLIDDLSHASAENWHLPIEYLKVTAPEQLVAGMSYTIYFQAAVDQARAQIIGFDGFGKGADIVLIPRWEQIPSALVPRDLRASGRMLWPAVGMPPPGHYRVTLPALKQSAEWDLEIVAP